MNLHHIAYVKFHLIDQRRYSGRVADATGTEVEEWELWRAFLTSHARVSRTIDAQLQRDSGLAESEYATITAILESPERHLRVGQIADALGWEKSRASHLISRMERRGLVKREICAEDGRAMEIAVTSEGRKRQVGAIRGHVAEVRRVFLEQIEPDERAVVTRALTRVLANLSRTNSAG
jgi:DNA-binding MarR family transcriptional regulator